MITERSIQKFFSATLIACSAGAFAVSFYLESRNILIVTLVAALFIFAVSFVLEWFHINAAGLVIQLFARFQNHKSKRKIER